VGEKLTAEDYVKLLRLEIVRAAKFVEAAHEDGLISDSRYESSKIAVLKATRYYNAVHTKWSKYRVFSMSERDEILALVIGIINGIRAEKGGTE